MLKEKKANHKPGSVSFVEKSTQLSIIYLVPNSRLESINLPSEIGRAALYALLQSSVYLVFQFVRFTLPFTSLSKR
jgi:hypothetical protein